MSDENVVETPTNQPILTTASVRKCQFTGD